MDVGVYYAGKFTTRADFNYQERQYFLELLALLDMGPRTALVLMVAVGVQLGANLGLIPLPATTLAMIWVIDLIWLALVWWQFLSPEDPRMELAAKLDYGLRYLVITVFMVAGLYAIFTDSLVIGAWLRL